MNALVGIISDNSESVVTQMLLSWKTNKAAVMISEDTPYEAIKNIVSETGVKKIYCNENVLQKYHESIPDIDFFPFNETRLWDIRKNIDNYLFPESEETALVLYSSGTTGKAKGIMLSHKAINQNAQAVIDYMKPDKTDSFFIVKNLIHSSTIVCEILVALKNGNNLFFADEHKNFRKILEQISCSMATIVCINPTILRILLKYPNDVLLDKLRNVNKLYVSGAILDAEAVNEARNRLNCIKIINVYGMTECGPRIASQENSSSLVGNSVGKAISQVKIRIIGEDGENIQDSFRVGIVEVNTPYRAQGYVNGQPLPIDKDGWISTNDLGYFDEEKNLYICGRADNMLNVSGHNVFPETIEGVVKRLECIEDCLVEGENNKMTGTKLVCFYKGNNVDKQAVFEFCRRHLLPHEIPLKFVEVNRIVYVNGKVKRKQFKETRVD